MIPINLGTEDALSQAVLERILHETGRSYAVQTHYNRGGYGYLKRMIEGFNNAAKGIPFLILTDLNATECPPALLQDWLPYPKHPHLLFRVAVREVESWLLADRTGIAKFLGIPKVLVPINPETVNNPKERIIELASRSRKRKLREAIVPSKKGTAKIGPDYNGALRSFVTATWNVEEARNNALSLKRCLDCLSSFVYPGE